MASRWCSSPLRFVSVILAVGSLVHADPWPALAIPPANARDRHGPSPRPAPGEVTARARQLFEAIRTGSQADGDTALGFFLQRDPFLAIKDMSGAAGYFATLVREFRRDVGLYHTEWPAVAHASFVRFDLSTACTWMDPGHEANRLPYWSCYHSHLVARAEGHEHTYDVRVMIQWGDRWFCTHLGPHLPTHTAAH